MMKTGMKEEITCKAHPPAATEIQVETRDMKKMILPGELRRTPLKKVQIFKVKYSLPGLLK